MMDETGIFVINETTITPQYVCLFNGQLVSAQDYWHCMILEFFVENPEWQKLFMLGKNVSESESEGER